MFTITEILNHKVVQTWSAKFETLEAAKKDIETIRRRLPAGTVLSIEHRDGYVADVIK